MDAIKLKPSTRIDGMFSNEFSEFTTTKKRISIKYTNASLLMSAHYPSKNLDDHARISFICSNVFVIRTLFNKKKKKK